MSASDYHAIEVEEEKKPDMTCARVAGGTTLGAGALVLGAFVLMSHRSTSSADLPPPPSPTTAAAKSSSGARLRITNGCAKDPLWIANFAFQAPYFEQDLKLAAGEAHEFAIPEEGLAATRFWAKWGCDETGSNCAIGQSGGPGEACSPEGCAPPLDSKFEATFGCLPSAKGKCAVNPSKPTEPLGPIDWWDTSQVDGWTLPYKVEVVGDCPQAPSLIDCSGLTLDACPEREDLGLPSGPETLRLMDGTGSQAQTVGCYAPCAKLTYPQLGQGHDFTPESKEAQMFCCPTPPVTPDECSKGPVITTQFVQAVHKLCPSVYAYSYDDGVGLAQCPAGTQYDVTFFCP